MRKKNHYVAKAAEYVPGSGPNVSAEVLCSEDGAYRPYFTVTTPGLPLWKNTARAKEVAAALNALEAKRSKDRRAAARRRKASK